MVRVRTGVSILTNYTNIYYMVRVVMVRNNRVTVRQIIEYRLGTHISHILICFLVKINQNVHIVNVCSM